MLWCQQRKVSKVSSTNWVGEGTGTWQGVREACTTLQHTSKMREHKRTANSPPLCPLGFSSSSEAMHAHTHTSRCKYTQHLLCIANTLHVPGAHSDMALLARSAGSLGSVQASRLSMRSRGMACVVRATNGEQFWVHADWSVVTAAGAALVHGQRIKTQQPCWTSLGACLRRAERVASP